MRPRPVKRVNGPVPGFLAGGQSGDHELARRVERSSFRSTVEERTVRSQTHIEDRREGALEHHPARLVARFKEGPDRQDRSVTGAGRRGADQGTTHQA